MPKISVEIRYRAGEGVVLEAQCREFSQILYRLRDISREGVVGQIQHVEFRGQRGRNLAGEVVMLEIERM